MLFPYWVAVRDDALRRYEIECSVYLGLWVRIGELAASVRVEDLRATVALDGFSERLNTEGALPYFNWSYQTLVGA